MTSNLEQSQICPSCGAPNTAAARYCEQCGRRLPPPAPNEPVTGAPADGVTRPLTPPRASSATTAGPPPWLTAPAAPSAPETTAAPARKRGLGGCLLGCLSGLIIAGLAVALVFLYVARPYVQDRARDQLNQLAATEVVRLGPFIVPSGQLIVTDNDINTQLATYDFSPLSEPVVNISPSGIQVTLKLAGTESTYRGNLAVVGGRLVVLNPTSSGPAGQLLRPADVSRIVEQQLAALLAQSHVRPIAVQLGAGSLTITTMPA